MNIIRHKNTDNTKCPICYDILDSEPQYTIPDCKHVFHTNCIVHWFRNGYTHCPLCNHCGLGTTKYATNKKSIMSHSIKHNITKFKLIKKYALKHNEPKWLIQKIDDYTKQLDQIKIIKKDIKNIKNKTGIYKDLHSKLKTLLEKLSKLEWNTRQNEKNILSFPLYP